MTRLAADCGETVILVRLVADSPVCVHRIESRRNLRISFEPGEVLPLGHGASTRLLLSSLSPAARQAALNQVAQGSPLEAEQLGRKVALAGRRGWATSNGEIETGVWTAAAAIRSEAGLIATVSVPSPLARTDTATRKKILSHVIAAGNEITKIVRQDHPELAAPTPLGNSINRARVAKNSSRPH
jgi:DNA-binding IclR family transcriptional regulator